MTRVSDWLVHLEKEPSQQCDECGRIAELRPYGKHGACVCFECAMNDKQTTVEQFKKRLSLEHRIDIQNATEETKP